MILISADIPLWGFIRVQIPENSGSIAFTLVLISLISFIENKWKEDTFSHFPSTNRHKFLATRALFWVLCSNGKLTK
uniref:Uncharacterized protein n=1 Tax=Phage DP-2017a TaxID=1955560 RepID=A0A1Q1PVM0_9VIRU|nr:hypothetical protein [Phage DP-2017a]AQN32077.1 hypothetical protein [Phage DP-2017a]AQN32093.1 hypothetical protein [Phage DP-2017a]AQN32109.1 hypothetical protein [Phage DP-2017a]AQN32125.1 hypothetical protein [Phage DP-2017a]